MRKIHLRLGMLFIALSLLFGCGKKDKPFYERLQPIPAESGFKMKGYWIWGGTMVKVDSVYHLFASRWPRKNRFPDDYSTESEIVWATSMSPLGPFEFKEVVIGERDSSFWDSNMTHNPTIHKIGDTYVLFYIGSDFTSMRPGSENLIRRVGYASAKNIEGPWIRSDNPIIETESNNPAVFVEKDRSIKLLYRDEKLQMFMAVAPSFRGPFNIVNDDVWPAVNARLEDFYLFKKDGSYHFICEDNRGELSGHWRWGVHLISDNGIDGWRKYDPVVAYNHSIEYEDGRLMICSRRERPQLFIEDGTVSVLLNGVYNGEESWCQPVPVYPPYNIDQ